jgi:1-acyl-sn-glycerol-3-phosphate acyltransferase
LKFGRGGFIPHLYHRTACALLGMKLEQIGALAVQRPLLLASNHSSWLDITVLAAAMPVSFVAKSEVGAWPGIGFLARLSRTIFVDRKRRTATGGATREIGKRLASGEAVVLFAEGTSSDHNRVLPFRSALIGAAREAIAGGGGEQVYVQPVSVAYPRRHGLPVLRRERPQIAWYGGMTLPKHLWELMKQGGPDAVISFGEPIRVTAETDRKLVAQRAENEVRIMTRHALRGSSEPAPILLEAQTG